MMAAVSRYTRQFVWSHCEDSGFYERVNHSVTSCNERDGRFMYAIAGFKGRGTSNRRGFEDWNDLGIDAPLDVLQLDVGVCVYVCVCVCVVCVCVCVVCVCVSLFTVPYVHLQSPDNGQKYMTVGST